MAISDAEITAVFPPRVQWLNDISNSNLLLWLLNDTG